MNKQQSYIQENKSALFDWFVFSISISLGFVFPTFKDFLISPAFSYSIVAALLLYAIGSWLKHLPLCYRMMRTGKFPEQISLLLFLAIGHWLIFFTIILFSEYAVRKFLGLAPVKQQNTGDGLFILGSIVLATFITWLVFRSKKRIKEAGKFSETYLFHRELVADILLIAGVSIFSFAFWEKGIIALLTARSTATIRDVWFMFIFLSIAYILFYLPLRYLFLIEDHSSRQTWRRLLLIFGFLLIRSLLEMIKI